MKQSSFLSRGLWACIALAALAVSVISRWVEPFVHTVIATARAVKNLALDGFMLAANQGDGKGRQLVRLVQAKAFILRLAKRDRPEVSGSWRMCPST